MRVTHINPVQSLARIIERHEHRALCLFLLIALMARSAQDYMAFFETVVNADPELTVNGLAVLKTAIPHFDVFVTPAAGLPLVKALVAAFELPTPDKLIGDDKEAAETLRLQAESQVEMTPEELAEFVAALEDAEAQGEAMQVRQ